jgi:hypothetical protein
VRTARTTARDLVDEGSVSIFQVQAPYTNNSIVPFYCCSIDKQGLYFIVCLELPSLCLNTPFSDLKPIASQTSKIDRRSSNESVGAVEELGTGSLLTDWPLDTSRSRSLGELYHCYCMRHLPSACINRLPAYQPSMFTKKRRWIDYRSCWVDGLCKHDTVISTQA